tara:strand:- start:461 stop:757 length:297 start_codon:yes stop_codon:yes gene_type:complete
MIRDWFQNALQTFNGGDWYSWKKEDSEGNKIPNDQRMTYANIVVIKEGATIPSEADVNAKIQELKDLETAKETTKASAKKKLQDLGLTVDEIKEAFGI